MFTEKSYLQSGRMRLKINNSNFSLLMQSDLKKYYLSTMWTKPKALKVKTIFMTYDFTEIFFENMFEKYFLKINFNFCKI